MQKKNDDSMLEDSLAVGAVVAPKSPVIDQPVATLRGLNGLYLVSVQRGDMLLRAVTPEFMLEEGDILHFTGLVESIGEVCVEHGLLPLTHETEESLRKQKAATAPTAALERRARRPAAVSPTEARSPTVSSPRTRAPSPIHRHVPPRGRAARVATRECRREGHLGARAETLARNSRLQDGPSRVSDGPGFERRLLLVRGGFRRGREQPGRRATAAG